MLDKQRIFAHRGLWGPGRDGNSVEALEQAISLGFSIETDIRDHLGKVVVSHDPVPEGLDPIALDYLIGLSQNSETYLALNVKADGLLGLLPSASHKHFFFDMSSPETLRYSKSEHLIALRLSDLEPELTPRGVAAEWLWLDGFQDDWYLELDFTAFAEYRGVVIVSPELHQRPKSATWKFAVSKWRQVPNLCICTDFPEEFLWELNR